MNTKDFKNIPIENDKIQPTLHTHQKKIVINEKISYDDANEFKSNIARNKYFQWQKLLSEQRDIEAKLEDLRKSYAENSDKDFRVNLTQKIISSENRLLEIHPLTKQLEKEMRNEEIKVIN